MQEGENANTAFNHEKKFHDHCSDDGWGIYDVKRPQVNSSSVNVQAIISNISFPKSLEDLRWFVYKNGHFNVEDIELNNDGGYVEWTVPKWITVNDIVFFFHAKTAISRISHLETLLKNNKNVEDYEILMDSLRRARELYANYGGKIFAIGLVLGRPFYDSFGGEELPWRGMVYAQIGDIFLLRNPVSIEKFSDFITVSRQSAITPVLGDDFAKLRSIIAEKNEVPGYLEQSIASPIPLNKINEENWLQLTQKYRRQFFQEIQFRKFYVDYFLKLLSDSKTIYRECPCYKDGALVGYADNGIKLSDNICFVEVKLDWDSEKDFLGQLRKYCNVEKAEIVKNKWKYAKGIVQKYVLIIDTTRFGIYDERKDDILFCINLDDVRTTEDILLLKEKVKEMLQMEENVN